MKEQFITSRPVGVRDLIANLVSPLATSTQNRVLLHSSRRQQYEVKLEDGAVAIDPLGGFDKIYFVKRTTQHTVLTFDCGIAEDPDGREYNIVCTLDIGFTVKDEAAALERVVRDFEAEYQSFTGLIQARMRELVRIFINETKALYAILDVKKCGAGLTDAVKQAPVAFELSQVTRASFGDPAWKDHPARRFRQEEVEAQDRHQQLLNNLRREEAYMIASQTVIQLQREYARRTEDFRLEILKKSDTQRIATIKDAYDKFGLEAALAIIDPAAFSLKAGHEERMSEAQLRALEAYKGELVAILKGLAY